MDEKSKQIKSFQKTKEASIQLAGVNRDAILLTTSSPETMKLPDDEIKKKIHAWRSFLWAEIYQKDPDEASLQAEREKPGSVPFK